MRQIAIPGFSQAGLIFPFLRPVQAKDGFHTVGSDFEGLLGENDKCDRLAVIDNVVVEKCP